MKKKILSILINLLAICSCMFCLSACGEKEPPHAHAYDRQVVSDTFKVSDATCEDKATYKFSCACGKEGTEIFESGEKASHVIENNKCSVCDKNESVGLEYQLFNSNTEYIVVGIGSCEDTDLIIPSTCDDIPVTAIDSQAFSGCADLTRITIPDSVTRIGWSAFSNCSSLTGITLPFVGATYGENSNTHFGYIFGAISYAYNNSYIPRSLRQVTITKATSIDSYAFCNCSNLTSVVIRDGVTSIGTQAFSNCSGLTNIIIPDSIISVGSQVFYNCNNLNYKIEGDLKYLGSSNNPYLYLASVTRTTIQNANIHNDCKFIGASVFKNCYRLTKIVVPESVISIGYNAFYNCSSLTEITLPFIGANRTATDYQAVFGYIFGYTTTLSSSAVKGAKFQYYDLSNYNVYYHYYIPDSITKVTITSATSISSQAFYNCSNLKNIVIGDGIEHVGENVFYNCTNLIYNEKGGLKYLGNSSNPYLYLVGTTSKDITTANIDSDCKFIGEKAFYDCDSLQSITIPDSVTNIGNYAFNDCSSLTSVVIGDGVMNVNAYAFRNCSILTSVVIGDSVDSIGSYAFYGCSSLKDLTIPDSTTSIGSCAFYGCSSLISAIIGDGVISIDVSTFYNCFSLASVEIGDSVTTIEEYAFFNCSSLVYVSIPETVTRIGYEAFKNCASLTKVDIGSCVTDIGLGAFSSCSSLANIKVNEKNANYKDIDGNLYTKDGTVLMQYAIGKTAKSFTILDGVTSIESSAFRNCTNLTSVVIPVSVNNIGAYAFAGCVNLKNIKYLDTESKWELIEKGSGWNDKTGSLKIECQKDDEQ